MIIDVLVVTLLVTILIFLVFCIFRNILIISKSAEKVLSFEISNIRIIKTRYKAKRIGLFSMRTVIILHVLKIIPHPVWGFPGVYSWMDAAPEDFINEVNK